jgi:hypothetical protein
MRTLWGRLFLIRLAWPSAADTSGWLHYNSSLTCTCLIVWFEPTRRTMNSRSLVLALDLVGGLAGPALSQDFLAAKSRGECESMHGVWDQLVCCEELPQGL